MYVLWGQPSAYCGQQNSDALSALDLYCPWTPNILYIVVKNHDHLPICPVAIEPLEKNISHTLHVCHICLH